MYIVSAGPCREWHLVHVSCSTLQHVAGQLQIGLGCAERVHLVQQMWATPFKYDGLFYVLC